MKTKERLKIESLESRLLLAGDPILDGQPLMISEVVANSSDTLLTRTRSTSVEPFDGESASPDWIEIMNISKRHVNLAGMHLTDDATRPDKWEFPQGTSIDAGGFLVVFASGDDIANPALDENGFLHTNFGLADNGEYLALTDLDGIVVHEFSESLPTQRVDVSYAIPMQRRTLIAAGSQLEYLVPNNDSLGRDWVRPGFEHQDFASGVGPIGYDRGDGEAEEGETIGAELIDRSRIDFATGSLAILESMPFTQAGRVSRWSFYSEKTTSVTPLVFRLNETGYELTGVGLPRTSDGSGIQTFDFELQSGNSAVEPDTFFFGIKDGDNDSDQAGAIVWSNSDTESIVRFNGPLSGRLNIGETFTDGRSFEREFSVQAIASPQLTGPFTVDVQAAMEASPSVYVRYPFAVENLALQRLTLNVRYDDGFVAYLNGSEVARRNAPDEPAFDSLATSNRSVSAANRFEEINISEYADRLVVGDNVLAIHGLNDQIGGSEFVMDAQIQGFELATTDKFSYASSSTPGMVNDAVFGGFVSEPDFSHDRGFYDQAFQLGLATPDVPDATIYYTTNGTFPTPDNPTAIVFQSPLDVDKTSIIRAAGYREGLLPSLPQTYTYVFPEDVKTQEGMQTAVTEDPIWGPKFTDSLKSNSTISIVTGEAISVEGELAMSVEWIYPDGSEPFQVDGGIEVFGGTAVSFPKRSMRMSFKNIYGPPTLKYDVFDDPNGVTEFDQLILRPGSHDTPFWNNAEGVGSYIRNRWANDQQLAMGQPSPRGEFSHLYLNGVYWGQYQVMERPNAAFMATHFGGTKDDYDVLNAGNVVDGDAEAWTALLDAFDDGYSEVKKYLDVENYADYVLLQFYGGNTVDWRQDANWMAARRREPGAGFQFFAWDSDIILRTGAESDIVSFSGPGFLWSRDGGLRQFPEFLDLLAERAQLHFFDDGLFSDAQFRNGIDEVAAQARPAIIAETARWGSGRYTPATWESAVQWIKDTYAPENGPSRAETVIEQMRHAGLFPLSDQPTMLINGSPSTEPVLSVGDQLTLEATNGAIYYTLDGSDPRASAPEISTTELASRSSSARVFVPVDGSLQQAWTSVEFDDGAWLSGQASIGFDSTGDLTPQIGFDVAEQMKDKNASAFVRIPFQVDDPSLFDTLRLQMKYDDGFVAYLNGVEIARRNAPPATTWNSRANRTHENIEAVVFEPFNLNRELSLLQQGENVLAIHALNSDVANVDLLIEPLLTAGIVTESGLSPAAILYTEPIVVPESTSIKARTIWADQWSTVRIASTDPDIPIRISEVMYHAPEPTDPELTAGFDVADEFEFIELVNISNETIDLSKLKFVQSLLGGQSNGIEFDFSTAAIQQLEAGGRVLVVENSDAFRARYGADVPVAGQWAGGLSNSSEQLTLMNGDTVLQQFIYNDSWHPSTDGNGSSLEIVNASNNDLNSWNNRDSWRASAASGGTPGRSGIVPGDSNHDGIFNSTDLVVVFQAGEYQDEVDGNSTFEEGDWNGDGDFTSRDLVFVFQLDLFVAEARTVAPSSDQLTIERKTDGIRNRFEMDRLSEAVDEEHSRQREIELATVDTIFQGLDHE